MPNGDVKIRNRADAFAVGQGECDTLLNNDGIYGSLACDAVAVQAEHHAVRGLPCLVFGKRHIAGQVVVARTGDAGQLLRCSDCHPASMVGVFGHIPILRQQLDLPSCPLQNDVCSVLSVKPCRRSFHKRQPPLSPLKRPMPFPIKRPVVGASACCWGFVPSVCLRLLLRVSPAVSSER